MKEWRRPTLAEPIGLLPSAQQCLTAVFGMGTGRTTAVLSPKNFKEHSALSRGTDTGFGYSLKTTHSDIGITTRELNSYFFTRKKKRSSLTTD